MSVCVFSCLTSFYDFILLLLSSHPWDTCAGLLHTGAHGVHLRGKNPQKKKSDFTSKMNPFKVTLIDFFFLSLSRSEKTLRPEGAFHLKLFQSASIDTLLFCIALCKLEVCESRECGLKLEFVSGRRFWRPRCCVG